MHISPFPVSRRRHGVAGCGVLLCLALAWGCSKQGEGERCDLNNGDFDCDTGLVCRGKEQLSIVGTGGIALCCPTTGTPSVDACRAGNSLQEPDLPDEQVPEATTPDSGVTESGVPVSPLPDAGGVVSPGLPADAGDSGP